MGIDAAAVRAGRGPLRRSDGRRRARPGGQPVERLAARDPHGRPSLDDGAAPAARAHGAHAVHVDHNLRAAYLHVLADALTSMLAVVALAGGMLYGWRMLDPLMGLAGPRWSDDGLGAWLATAERPARRRGPRRRRREDPAG